MGILKYYNFYSVAEGSHRVVVQYYYKGSLCQFLWVSLKPPVNSSHSSANRK